MHWIALQRAPEAPGAAPPLLPDAATALGWWALQFTPLVAQVEAALVLEVSASERLFGGRAALAARLGTQDNPVGPLEYAHGATSLLALGRLWSHAPHSPRDQLPLHALAAARPHLGLLARLGCQTWGQLRALPRGGVARRCGAALVDALDRAYGARPEAYPWLQLPEVFDVALELATSVESAPALLFAARRLLAQLQLWLQARQRGVLVLELRWELDPRRSNAQHVDAHHQGGAHGQLRLQTAEPAQEMQHVQRLLAEQLARVTLPAPVLGLRLRTLQTQALAGESRSLLWDEVRAGDSLQQLLERLVARLGPQQVLRPTLAADHRPERMQQWRAALADAIHSGASGAAPAGVAAAQIGAPVLDAGCYPCWLVEPPEALVLRAGVPHYHGPLQLLAGPQRLEAGWLDTDAGSALRDYFVARSPVAGRVWIYRERLHSATTARARWYLHGLFA
ncbi:MAG: DNA polymerase Y family protein [Burkholderiales bacterium]|nr:DNA polymerase Y family protein [Burkholderiales bacterium]